MEIKYNIKLSMGVLVHWAGGRWIWVLVSVLHLPVILGRSNISRPRLPGLHSNEVKVKSVNVNKEGASPLGDT